MYLFFVFFFKQKTAYEMRISDWSSDVCSSDLQKVEIFRKARQAMKDTEARTTLEKCDVEEVCPPERIERNFLEGFLDGIFLLEQIGRASCRERVCQYV